MAEALMSEAQLGPAMQALANDKQRAFVVAAVDYPRRKGRWTHAARAAGYGTPTSTPKALGVIASRLAADERIQAAIIEESRKRMRALAPSAVHALDKLIEDPKHRDHARAVAMIVDRADPIETRHAVTVAHEHRVSPGDIAMVRSRIAELAKRAGLLPAPAPIDGEFKVVEDRA